VTRDRAFGIALLAALGLHAAAKAAAGVALLPEMLWACHVATLLMAIGFLVRAHRLVAAALVFHAGMGVVGWLLDVAAHGTTPTSVLAHALPLVLGAIAVRERGVPRGSAAIAWLLWAALQPLSRLLTPPALDVNLAWSVWPPVARLFPNQAVYIAFNVLLAIPFLAAAQLALARVARPAPAAS
jgi:hypothetical protein